MNAALKTSRCFLRSQREMTKPSRATVRMPGAGPKRRTEVNTKVSETEIVAGTEGTLTVIDPLSSVSPARINHSFGTPVTQTSYAA